MTGGRDAVTGETVVRRLTGPAQAEVNFEQVDEIDYTSAEHHDISSFWQQRQAENPQLFDGPIVAARGCRWDAEICTVSWSVARYAHYLWRDAPGNDVAVRRYARSLFVSVSALTEDGALLLGRMAAATSTPGRVQLPGGNVEPPSYGKPLTIRAVRQHAVDELAEETGLRVPSDATKAWAVKHGGTFGDVGIIFRADVPAIRSVLATFEEHLATLTAAGETPELMSLLAVPGDAAERHRAAVRLESCVDYVPLLLQLAQRNGPGH